MHASSLFSSMVRDCVAWRHFLHRNPEMKFDLDITAAFVRRKLEDFGCDEVVAGVGRSGVVGVISGNRPGRTIGLRADMDALPIHEDSDKPYRSQTPGRMHACGHDGHSAMLLAAAGLIAANRDFDGRVAVIFQPAEEEGCGGKVMIEDGLMERFAIDSVFGMHNLPKLPVGRFAIRSGPIMAASAAFDIHVKGVGGHAAMPHLTRDPLVAAADLVRAMQTIVSRRTDPTDPAVLSFTRIAGGESYNIIPDAVALSGTVRAMSERTMDAIRTMMTGVCDGIARENGLEVTFDMRVTCPATVNHDRETHLAAEAASRVAGEAAVDRQMRPLMIGEDFSFMLQSRPGAFIFIGNGPSHDLHHAAYDFDDAAISYGVKYWLSLVGGDPWTSPLSTPA